jgi:hypothetical protein
VWHGHGTFVSSSTPNGSSWGEVRCLSYVATVACCGAVVLAALGIPSHPPRTVEGSSYPTQIIVTNYYQCSTTLDKKAS